jgi:hypothetical protein
LPTVRSHNCGPGHSSPGSSSRSFHGGRRIILIFPEKVSHIIQVEPVIFRHAQGVQQVSKRSPPR